MKPMISSLKLNVDMTKLNSQSSEVEWLKQVHELLVDIARSALGDIPKLPHSVSTHALPLAQHAQLIQKKAAKSTQNSSWPYTKSQWLEEVCQLLLKLSRISLSERPILPENIAQTALMLAETAQDLHETLEENPDLEFIVENEEDDLTNGLPPQESSSTGEALFESLRKHLKTQQDHSSNPNAAQWQQMFTLIDITQELYDRIQS